MTTDSPATCLRCGNSHPVEQGCTTTVADMATVVAETVQERGRRIAVDLLESYGPETMVGAVCTALLATKKG